VSIILASKCLSTQKQDCTVLYYLIDEILATFMLCCLNKKFASYKRNITMFYALFFSILN